MLLSDIFTSLDRAPPDLFSHPICVFVHDGSSTILLKDFLMAFFSDLELSRLPPDSSAVTFFSISVSSRVLRILTLMGLSICISHDGHLSAHWAIFFRSQIQTGIASVSVALIRSCCSFCISFSSFSTHTRVQVPDGVCHWCCPSHALKIESTAWSERYSLPHVRWVRL